MGIEKFSVLLQRNVMKQCINITAPMPLSFICNKTILNVDNMFTENRIIISMNVSKFVTFNKNKTTDYVEEISFDKNIKS